MTLLQYIKALNANFKSGDAREHSHRPALVNLLETEKGIHAMNEPAQIDGNAPDIAVKRRDSTLGFIETKDIGKDLRAEINSEQLTRYRDAFPNLLLTNYLDWIWFVDSVEIDGFRIGRVVGGKVQVDKMAVEGWGQFIGNFLAWKMPSVVKPKELAKHLAGKTRQLRAATLALLGNDDSEINAQYKTFRQYLLPSMEHEEFADMFAQTISYGLFTARCFGKTGEIFARARTETLIPASNPLLREFFHHITGPNLSRDLAVLVDNITEFLSRVDLHSILEEQGRKAGFEDPVFHFYETFLTAYDSKLRERRGVYYTPTPVVDFIVRGVDTILRTRFNRADGLADKNTLILDPAVGTATFLRRVVEIIRQTQMKKGQGGAWNRYVKEHLLPRVFGFELMMAPYTVAHLKLAMQLSESKYEFSKKERLQIFLTNTLDQLKDKTGQLMSQWLVDEAKNAETVKNVKPVQVVLGNPPYSGESATNSQWSKDLIAEYKKEPDGSVLNERTAKWINDDYVKFIGFAQWRVKQTGHGVVAFIANHAWLDNPTFRGMRAALLRDFDEIRIVDLHGNIKKKEKGPEGDKEEGVFDIQQGVAIFFLIRKEGGDHEKNAQVFHRDLWGRRLGKYATLLELDVDSDGWEEIKPTLPLVLFTPMNEELRAEYENGWRVTDIFPLHGTGVITKRDSISIHFLPEAARKAALDILEMDKVDFYSKYNLPKDVRDWRYEWAKKDIEEFGLSESLIQSVLYRPFDVRSIVYTGKTRGFIGWPVMKIMRHMLAGENVGLVTVRQVAEGVFNHALVTESIVESRITISNKGVGYLFPLYIYPEADERNGDLDNGRKPNIAKEFLQALKARIGMSPSPEEILHYAYAVFHSPAYRKRYAGFLKSDFPRLPLTADKKKFARLAKLGAQLADLHLMRAADSVDSATQYPVSGTDIVDKVRYDEKTQRVYINQTQFFGGVQKAEWEFFIGGYQVLGKYLKDRKGRQLDAHDMEHYQYIVAVIGKTRRLMKEVDKAIGKWPMA